MLRIFIFIIYFFLINLVASSNISQIIQSCQEECKHKDAKICYKLGVLYKYGDGVTQNYYKAKEMFGIACDKGFEKGCKAYKELNEMNYKGFLDRKDYFKAVKIYQNECQEGNERSCNIYKTLNILGELKFLDIKNYFETINRYLKNCNKNNVKACFELGKLYFKRPLRKSLKSAKILEKVYRKNNIENYLVIEKLFKQNKKNYSSRNLFQKACDKGSAEVCLDIGKFYYKYGKYNIANEFYQQACNKGSTKLCFELGEENSIDKNYNNAMMLYQQACNKGYIKACLEAGTLYDKGKKYHDAAKWYEKACNKKSAGGCLKLSKLYFLGQGVRQNYSKAKQLQKVACKYKVLLDISMENDLKKFTYYNNNKYKKFYFKKALEDINLLSSCANSLEKKRLEQIKRELKNLDFLNRIFTEINR